MLSSICTPFLSTNSCFIITSEIWLSIKITTEIDWNYLGVLVCSNYLQFVRSSSKCCGNLRSLYRMSQNLWASQNKHSPE
jgi:hypothetical protein